ncbi:MAG: type II toxin-antitoxin system VapC family toxin [Rhodocyclaceae bacterium]|nr:MAG: type II toxin-antitoxin system VapC family toxin [Rhodocyclaceae bacterium]
MRILADTSVWVDYLRNKRSPILDRLSLGDVVTHDYVIGEIVLGGISQAKLSMFNQMRRCRCASHDEVMHLIAERNLAGRGLGYVDSHLLAAALIGRLQLWTLDTALQQVAQECGCGLVVH